MNGWYGRIGLRNSRSFMNAVKAKSTQA